MTIENDRDVMSTAAPSDTPMWEQTGGERPDAGEVAAAAKAESAAVAQSATEAGREVMGEVSDQVSAVASSAKDQIETFVGQAKDELKSQGEARGQQMITGLQSFSERLSALAQGRPQEAGNVAALVGDAQHRLQSYVSSLQQRGPTAIVDDVSSFARRRPGTFLLAAGIAGFAIGRVVRAGAATSNGSSRGPNSAQLEAGSPLAPPSVSGPTASASAPASTFAEPELGDRERWASS